MKQKSVISSTFWTNICHPKQENQESLNESKSVREHKHSDFTYHSARGYDIQSCSDGIGKHNEQNATAQSSIMIVHSDSTNISNDKKGSARATSSMAGQPPWQQGVPTTSCICSFVFSTDATDALDALR